VKKGTYLDLSRQQFGRVFVVSIHSVTKQGALWNAQCDCGTRFVVRGIHVSSGHTTSCGCRSREALAEHRTTHGLSRTYEYKLWKDAKHRAKKFNRPFNIECEDIVVPAKCPLLGISLFRGVGKVGSNSPSVDCLRPELGYTKGNVWVISYRANTIKNNLTLEQLKSFVTKVERKIGGCNE